MSFLDALTLENPESMIWKYSSQLCVSVNYSFKWKHRKMTLISHLLWCESLIHQNCPENQHFSGTSATKREEEEVCYVCMMLSYIENPSRLAQDVVQLVSHSVSTTLLHRLCLGMYFCTKIIVLLHAKKKRKKSFACKFSKHCWKVFCSYRVHDKYVLFLNWFGQ